MVELVREGLLTFWRSARTTPGNV